MGDVKYITIKKTYLDKSKVTWGGQGSLYINYLSIVLLDFFSQCTSEVMMGIVIINIHLQTGTFHRYNGRINKINSGSPSFPLPCLIHLSCFCESTISDLLKLNRAVLQGPTSFRCFGNVAVILCCHLQWSGVCYALLVHIQIVLSVVDIS